jgi:hypothetical protein
MRIIQISRQKMERLAELRELPLYKYILNSGQHIPIRDNIPFVRRQEMTYLK